MQHVCHNNFRREKYVNAVFTAFFYMLPPSGKLSNAALTTDLYLEIEPVDKLNIINVSKSYSKIAFCKENFRNTRSQSPIMSSGCGAQAVAIVALNHPQSRLVICWMDEENLFSSLC